MTAPPPRPIISRSGSFTENLGVFVEHYIKYIANKHSSYTQDTPDFLRLVDHIDQGHILSKNAILATIHGIGANTNIPQKDETHCLRKSLDERRNQKIPP